MSRNLYQFNEFQSEQPLLNVDTTALDDYLSYDLKLSDPAFNDIFSEFNANPNNFQSFDGSINDVNSSQSTAHLPPSNNATLLSMTTNNTMQSTQSELDQLLSSDTLELLIEQHQRQQSNMKSSSSSPYSIPTNHHEISTNTSVQHSKLIKKPEPISVTFDQFQALICAAPYTRKTNVNTMSTLLENSTIIGNNIPLKIVHETANENGGRVQRKPSHNAIEKRYRCSINEKILELKELVGITDEKIQKSGILRRTVEYIRQLQSANQRLEEENSTLKNILIRLNLTNIDFPKNNDVQSSNRRSSIQHSTTTPSPSCSYSSESIDEAYSPVPKRKKRTNSKRGMVNGSRLVLCCFMLCILIINPFNYLLDHLHSSDNDDTTEIQSSVGSRTLQATTNLDSSISWNKLLIVWMLNIAICLVCLVKLFVHGEPIVYESDMDNYYIYKKKADQFMNENQLNEARIYYLRCCETLYVPMDHTFLSYFTSLTWQIIRLFLNLIFVGRWLTSWSAWTNSIDTRDYNLHLNDCLFQLWKIEYHYSTSLLNLFNLFLSTINSSINCGQKLNKNKRNEICLLSILTLKKLNGLFHLFIPYLFKCLQPIDMNDIWLLDIHRLNEFLFEKEISLFKHKIFLESVRIQYFVYILYNNIQNQLLYQDEQYIIIIENDHRFSWWQHCLQVIRCISNDKQNINNITSTDLLRQSEQSNQTIYHRAREIQIIDERFIRIIETIHHILLVLTDDDVQTDSTRMVLLEKLGQTSRLLTSMTGKCFDENNLDLAIKTLLFDGILSLRLRLLTISMTNMTKQFPFLDDFQRELEDYKQLNQFMKLPKQRLYLFESIFRASSGLNPLIIETLFERALKQSNSIIKTKEESLPNLDIISALLLFSHFLPSIVFRYRNILQQAVAISLTTNKNNDLNRLQQQCLTLVRQTYCTL